MIGISNGELQTFGYPNKAGGVYRTLPVTFPLTFAFDSNTQSTRDQCNNNPVSNDAGW